MDCSPPNQSGYEAEEKLHDGTAVHIRAVRAGDKARLLDHFNRLSPQARRFRFFAGKRTLSERELQRLTELDFVKEAAIALTLADDGSGRFIGVAPSRSSSSINGFNWERLSSIRYLLRNSSQRWGSWPNNFLSSSEGPSSRIHFSMRACSFLRPRGHSRS